MIQACPADEECSKAIVIQGVEQEPYPINPTECTMIPKAGKLYVERGGGEGQLFAQQLLGIGPYMAPKDSLVPFGVFISHTEKPTREELAKARAALAQRFVEIVAEANIAWSQGRAAAAQLIVPAWHFVAARALQKTALECPWMGDTSLPAERATCPGCGTPYEIGIAECPKCGDVLDAQKYGEKMERIESARKNRKKA